MTVQLRGVVAAGVGARSLELALPAGGAPLSRVLALLRQREPRLERYLPQARLLLNERSLADGEDPLVQDSDELMLLVAVAGG